MAAFLWKIRKWKDHAKQGLCANGVGRKKLDSLLLQIMGSGASDESIHKGRATIGE